jgi:Holliday junction resolvase RusA-like endonuclease
MIELIFTKLPPSVNRIWRSDRGGRPHKSNEYREWLKSSGWEAKAQVGGKHITGRYKMSVQLLRPDRRRRDLDNFGFKAISDLLVSLGIVEDDYLCEMLSARWVTQGPALMVMIERAGIE